MAGSSRPFRVELDPGVSRALRRLPPEIKRPVREALRKLAVEPHLGGALHDDLAGLRRLRVGRHRIVYEIDARRRRIRVHAVGHRREVYELL